VGFDLCALEPQTASAIGWNGELAEINQSKSTIGAFSKKNQLYFLNVNELSATNAIRI
jgi:hypothetical protein